MMEISALTAVKNLGKFWQGSALTVERWEPKKIWEKGLAGEMNDLENLRKRCAKWKIWSEKFQDRLNKTTELDSKNYDGSFINNWS